MFRQWHVSLYFMTSYFTDTQLGSPKKEKHHHKGFSSLAIYLTVSGLPVSFSVRPSLSFVYLATVSPMLDFNLLVALFWIEIDFDRSCTGAYDDLVQTRMP